MSKPRLEAIEYIRALGMMGVVGIHVGSQYLTYNPTPNINLVAIYEILTRFSVPIFFFVSAFGLFYNLPTMHQFDYRDFLKRRGRAVAIPYLVWSCIYMAIYTIWQHNLAYWYPENFLRTLFFGLAAYQLYFLVILLWFYILMPLWIYLVPRINIRILVGIFIAQLAFNYWSTTTLISWNCDINFIDNLVKYRLNYWVGHYFFIFLLGAYLAYHYNEFTEFMRSHRRSILLGATISTIWILGYYYYCILMWHYSPESAVNTAHQLSVPGLCYTLMMSLGLFSEFTREYLPPVITKGLQLFGKHSYFVYLVHPLIIYILIMLMQKLNLVLTGMNSLIFYSGVLIISTICAIAIRRFSSRYAPWINRYTIGIYPRK